MKYFTMYYILGLAPHFYIYTLQALHGAFCHGSSYYQPVLTKTEAAKKKKKKKYKPIKKWSVDLNRHFSKDTNGQKAHEKMLNVLNYQTNANKNSNEVSSYTGKNGHHQKTYKD